MSNYHLTIKSSNAKTGPMPVSTTSADTCPPDCPLREGTCYAKGGGPLLIHWRKVSDGSRGESLPAFNARIRALPEGTLWRHNQAGDLPGEGNDIDTGALSDLVDANRGRKGYTYTHKPVLTNQKNADAVEHANRDGFTINLSANGLRHADKLKALGIGPVVTMLPDTVEGRADITTPAGHRVVVCPATYRDGVTCATCKLCAWADRDVIIGFPAHGSGARKVREIFDAN